MNSSIHDMSKNSCILELLLDRTILERSLTTDLQTQLIALIRAFGLHHPEQTPCGQPVAVAEAHALMELMQAQPLSQNNLAMRLSLEKSTVSRLVKILDDRGWINRSRCNADRRVMEIVLTDAGKQAAQKLAFARQAKFDRVIAALPQDQRAGVIDALKILVEAMRENQ